LLHSERVIRLKRLRILEKLSDAALQSVAGKCKWRSYAAGEQILGHGDTSTDVSFLLAGNARAISYSRDGKAVVFVDLKPDYGPFCGSKYFLNIDESQIKRPEKKVPYSTCRNCREIDRPYCLCRSCEY
jgi:hypothetical protein